MPRLALSLLGPPRLQLDGEPIHIARRKAVALLAYLVVTGRSHSRDSLATLFWPGHDQSRARAGLRRTLSLLNGALGGEWLTVDREAAGLNPDGENWFTVGHVPFPVEDPVQVGLHAIGNIDRSVYHGAYPDGTAIRFESFQLWGLNR
jgi:hypothetical protein